MWLVTWESKKGGAWAADPESFRTKRDAVKYMKDCLDVLLPKNRMVLYRCDRVSSLGDVRQPEGKQ